MLHAPPAIGGVLIALIIFTPERMSVLRAALGNQLQRAVNLCLGGQLAPRMALLFSLVGIGLVINALTYDVGALELGYRTNFC